MAPLPLTSDDFIGKKLTSQNKKPFLPRLMKLLVAYKFLTKCKIFCSQCISGHVISRNMEFITLAISQPFLKIETSGLDQKIL